MIVYLTPHSPFAKSVPRSDTIFGAISWAVHLLYGRPALEDLLGDFDSAEAAGNSPPFVVASLLPFFKDDDGKIRLLPRPLQPQPLVEEGKRLDAYQAFKKLKKAKWLSETVFTEMINGRLSERDVLIDLIENTEEKAKYRLHAGALMTNEEYERMRILREFTHSDEAARNSINRIGVSTSGEGGQLFYQPIVSSVEERGRRSGFYIPIRTDGRKPIEDMLKAAFRFIGDKGLGGDATVGRGHCDVEFSDSDAVPEAPDGNRLITLSLMHPGAADLRHFAACSEEIYARLEKRKGFLEVSYLEKAARVWKPTLFMLAEGAVFPRDGDRKVYGALFKDESVRQGVDYNVRINGLAYVAAMKGGDDV